MSDPRATGRCLCGAVRYEVRGPMRDILLCHCVECARANGYLGAYSATRAADLIVLDDATLRWVDSPESDRHARRGFCGGCGSSLFWQAADAERINVAVGTLDRPTGLRLAGHWYVHHADDYDQLPADGLPRNPDPAVSPIRWS
jgi:hypothetical protein